MTTSPSLRARRAAPVLIGLLVFIGALLLFLQDQNFPYFYHPDEPWKVDQILHDTRNFHHPQLLLNTVALAVLVTHPPPDAQSIAVVGRRVAAFYAAAAAALLAMAVVSSCGAPAGIVAAALIVCTPPLVDVAHFFKEDTAFTFGIAAFLAALVALDRWPRRATVLLLGAALGLLVSSKYIGILALPPALLFLRWKARRSPDLGWSAAKCASRAALVLLAVAAIVNFQVVLHFPSTVAAIGQEMRQVHALPTGLSERVPHNYLGRMLARETTPLVAVFAGLAVLAPFLSRRRPRAIEWAVLGFPLLYWIAVSFSGKVSPRYYEPMAVLLSAGAAIGLHRTSEIVAGLIPVRRPLVAGGLLVLGALAMLAPSVRGVAQVQSDFRADSRRDLALFIQANLPAQAVIAQDANVRLPSAPRGFANDPTFVQKILPPAPGGPVADLGTLDALRAAGVTHIVIAKADSGAYLSKRRNKAGLDSPDNLRRRAFYERLLLMGKPIWQARASRASYVRQELTLYALP